MPDDIRRIPDYLLERVAAGDLTPEERHAVLDRLAREKGGAERLALIARDDRETLERLPPARVTGEVRRRSSGRHRSAWLLIPVFAAAGAVSLFLFHTAPRAPRSDEMERVRVKGLSPHLLIHRRTATGVELVAPGTPARAGDLLQLAYVSAGRGFGVILSVDGRGAVTRHWPAHGTDAAALTPGGEVLLPESFRLDDAPGFERFFLVTSDRPFAVAGALDAARALARRPDASEAPLPLTSGLSESSILVLKEIR